MFNLTYISLSLLEVKYRYYITDGYIFISNDIFFHWNHGLKLNFVVFFVVEKNGQNGQKWPKNGQKWEISVRKGFMCPRNAFLREKMGQNEFKKWITHDCNERMCHLI